MLYEKWFLGEMQEWCSVEDEFHNIQKLALYFYPEKYAHHSKSYSTSKTSVCCCVDVMTVSVSGYHEFDYWFDCWEILPGHLGNKLLIQWWLASVAGIWKESKRGFGRERNAKSHSEAKEGVISTFTWWMFVMQKTIVSWHAFPSLLSFLLHQKPTFPSIWKACHTG